MKERCTCLLKEVLDSGMKGLLASTKEDIPASGRNIYMYYHLKDGLASGNKNVHDSGKKYILATCEKVVLASGQKYILATCEKIVLAPGKKDIPAF